MDIIGDAAVWWLGDVIVHAIVKNQIPPLIETELDIVAFDFPTDCAEAYSGLYGVFNYGKPLSVTLIARFGNVL